MDEPVDQGIGKWGYVDFGECSESWWSKQGFAIEHLHVEPLLHVAQMMIQYCEQCDAFAFHKLCTENVECVHICQSEQALPHLEEPEIWTTGHCGIGMVVM